MSSIAKPITEIATTLRPPSDQELIEKFLVTRNPDVIATLYKRYGALVIGACHRVLTNREDMEDVLQATYLILMRDLHRIRKRTSVACWLYGVAYRLSRRILRTQRTRQELTLVDEARNGHDAFENLSRRHDLKTLDEELNALPDKFREVLVLRYLTERSTSDVARELGISVGAVDGLLKRGKQQLRQRLLRRGVSAGIALAAIQIAQQSAAVAFGKENLDWIVLRGLDSGAVPVLPKPDPIPNSAVELAAKEMMTMATATKSVMAMGLLVGGLAVGFGATNWMFSPHGGGVNAAGISTALSADQALRGQIETTIVGGDPTGTGIISEQELAATIEQPNQNSELIAQAEPTATQSSQSSESKKRERTPFEQLIHWGYRPKSLREAQILSKLDAQCGVNFSDSTLKNALHFLEAAQEIPILIDERALAEESISLDTRFTLGVIQNSTSNVLDLLLEPWNLDYIIKNDTLMITTQTEAEKFREVRVYDVSQLQNVKSAELIKVISEIFPETQKTPDEPNGITTQGDRRIVVRNTRRIHEKIVDLLNQLEESEKK